MKKLTIKFYLITSLLFFSSLFSAQSVRKVQHIVIKDVPEAIAYTDKIVEHTPSEAAAFERYEKEKSDGLVVCTKLLSDAARKQLLQALAEIDNRIAYWQYQKDHPWNYFVSKNPLKWFAGPAQEKEVIDNLELLETYQSELYTVLGNLAQRDADFVRGYKDLFLADYQRSYVWIDSVLEGLARIETVAQRISLNPFIARIKLLQAQLESVPQFKNQLLSEIKETAIPSYLARNWLKSSMFLFALGYGYNKLSLEQLQQPFISVGKGVKENVVDPIQILVSDVFLGGADPQSNLLVSQSNLNVMYDSVKKFLDTLSTKPGWFGGQPEITEERKQEILAEIKSGQSSKLQELSNELSGRKWANAKGLFSELFILQGGERGQRTVAGVGKIAFMTPAIAFAWATYAGYKKLTEKNYGSLRRDLAEINDLFVDSSRPLDNEQYGKMLYMIYMLKQRAQKELPEKKNIRQDFIADLERLESRDLDLAAKYRIVDNMYKKYSFLGLIDKK
jgi:hypothetical protein